MHVKGGKVLESAFLPCSLSQGVISPHFLIRPLSPSLSLWPNHVQEKVQVNVVGLKLLGEKSKTFLRLAEEEEEEEGAGKTVQVCARGSSSCSRFRALSLPRQRQGSESQPGCLRGSKRAVVWPQEPRRGQGAATGASHCGRAPGQPQHLQGLCLKVRRILCQECSKL